MTRPALILVAVLLSACAGPSAGTRWDDVPLDPEAWVDARLAPDLARRLAEHPRFTGATLAVGLPGDLDRAPSRLEARLDEALESRLMHAEGLRLRASAPGSCPAVDADYRLGLVVTDARGEHRVELRVLETASGEWVSGLADSWQGPLSRRDRADLAAPAGTRGPGAGPDHPFGPDEIELAAQALAHALSCELVAARLAPGRIEAGPDPLAAPTAAYLATLGHSRSDVPGWRLDMRRVPQPGAELVVARLSASEGMVAARTYVAAQPARQGAPAGSRARPVAVSASPPAALPAAPRIRPAACGPRCFGVSSGPAEDLVLLAIIPGRGLTSTRGCPVHAGPAGRRTVTVPGQDAGWARFYAVKGHGRRAGRLEELAARLPSACGAGVMAREGAWLAELEAFADEAGPGIDWTGVTVDARGPGDHP